MATQQESLWAGLVRAYLMHHDEALFDRVLAEASGQPEIQRLLEAYREQPEATASNIEAHLRKRDLPLFPEERRTLHLLQLDPMCNAVGGTDVFLPAADSHTVEAGLEACEDAMRVSEELGDSVCVAHYASLLGRGCLHLHDFIRAEAAFRRALTLRYQLYAARPDVHAGDLATTLNDLGNILIDLTRYDEAEHVLREALSLLVTLHKNEPDVHAAPLARVYNSLGILLRRQRRFEDASTVMQKAQILREQLYRKAPQSFTKDLAVTLDNMGSVFDDLARYEEAEAAYREALTLRQQLVHEQPHIYKGHLAASWNNLGTMLSEQTRHEEAEDALREALDLYRVLHREQPEQYAPELAIAWSNLGTILRDQTKYDEAIKCLRKAIALHKELYQAQPHVYAAYLATTWNNLGDTFLKDRRYEEAEAALNEALSLRDTLYREQPQVYAYDLATTLDNLGNVHTDWGRHQEAEAAFRRALHVIEQLPQDQQSLPAVDLAAIWDNLSVVLARQHNYEGAETALREALALREVLYHEQPQVYASDLAVSWLHLGTLHADQAQYKEAEAALQEALVLWTELYRRQPHVYASELAMSWNNLGTILSDQGRYQEAETTLRKALVVYHASQDTPAPLHPEDLILFSNNLGGILLDQHRYAEAEAAYHSAIEGDPEHVFEAGTLARWGLGDLFRMSGRTGDTYPFWLEALSKIEKRRGRLPFKEDRSILHGQHAPRYDEMVRLCLGLGRSAEAWHWAERGKARILLDQFASARPRLSTEEQRRLYAQWQQAEREVAHLRFEVNPPLPSKWERDLREKEEEAFERRQALAFSIGAAAVLLDVQVPSPGSLAGSLQALVSDSYTLLVQFVLLGIDRYVIFLLPLWQVASDEPLPLIAEEHTFDAAMLRALTDSVQKVSEALEKGERAIAEELMAPIPERLGQIFFQPWKHHLDHLQPDNLILVPSGVLHRLPLHAALCSNGRSLLETYPTLYLGSASLAQYLADRRNQTSRPTGRLILGPAHPPDHVRYQIGADRETQRLAEAWDVQRYAFEEMVTDVLRRHAGQVEFVHLATHSVFDTTDYLQSHLQFHREYLTLFELISDVRLDFSGTRLCYLSSCEAGSSDIGRAEDLQGLVWALMYAGAEAVMASLWPVEDEVSAWMASAFYRRLDEGLTLVEAYQEAVVTVRAQADFANPLYWAPFVLFGNGLTRGARSSNN